MIVKNCIIGIYTKNKEWFTTDPFDGDWSKVKKEFKKLGEKPMEISITFDLDSFDNDNQGDKKPFKIGSWTVKYNPFYPRKYSAWQGQNCNEEFGSWYDAIKHAMKQQLFSL